MLSSGAKRQGVVAAVKWRRPLSDKSTAAAALRSDLRNSGAAPRAERSGVLFGFEFALSGPNRIEAMSTPPSGTLMT